MNAKLYLLSKIQFFDSFVLASGGDNGISFSWDVFQCVAQDILENSATD